LDCGYHHKGLVHLFADRKKYQKEVEETELLKSFGVETAILDVDELREREPNLHPVARYGIYYPDYAHIIPDRFVSELALITERMGVQVCEHTEVLGFETIDGRIHSVHTSRQTFEPDQVVLAAGAWSVILARQLGIRLPIQPAKGYSLTFDRPPVFPNTPLSLVDRKVAITPMGDKLRCTSTLELAGFDPSLSQRRLAAIHREASKYLPGIGDLEPERTWSGFRPASPDGLPIIERNASIKNLVLATGHGMLGLTQGPITGKLVSQIIAHETPEIDLSPLSLNRFS
jgi:D-amino-acid dehydrogenase